MNEQMVPKQSLGCHLCLVSGIAQVASTPVLRGFRTWAPGQLYHPLQKQRWVMGQVGFASRDCRLATPPRDQRGQCRTNPCTPYRLWKPSSRLCPGTLQHVLPRVSPSHPSSCRLLLAAITRSVAKWSRPWALESNSPGLDSCSVTP